MAEEVIPAFDVSQLTDLKNYRIQAIEELSVFKSGTHARFIERFVGAAKVREFVSDINSSYRCIGK